MQQESARDELLRQLERLERLLAEPLHGNGNSSITIKAAGYGTTLLLLLVLAIIGGFAYIRQAQRIDGLYDRLDAIYMMAPQLRQENTHEFDKRPAVRKPERSH